MNCAYFDKSVAGSWQSERKVMKINLDLNKDEPKKQAADSKLSLNNTFFN